RRPWRASSWWVYPGRRLRSSRARARRAWGPARRRRSRPPARGLPTRPIVFSWHPPARSSQTELLCTAERPSSAAPAAREPLKHKKRSCGRRLLKRLVRRWTPPGPPSRALHAGSNPGGRPRYGTCRVSVGRAGRLPGGSTPQNHGRKRQGDGAESKGPGSIPRRMEIRKDLRRRVVDPDADHLSRLVPVELEAVLLGLQVEPRRAEGGDNDADDRREVPERHENQQPGGPGPRGPLRDK